MKIPAKLYKYLPYSSYALESLIQQKIWISDPKDFNDPFDAKLRTPKISTIERVYKIGDWFADLIGGVYMKAEVSRFPYATMRNKAPINEFCVGLPRLGQRVTKSLSRAA